LQAPSAQFRNRCCAGKQGNSIVEAERTRRAGLAVNFCEETNTALAGKSDRCSSQKKVEHFRMFVAPTPGIDIRPALVFS
jgi:hypothetical protein